MDNFLVKNYSNNSINNNNINNFLNVNGNSKKQLNE